MLTTKSIEIIQYRNFPNTRHYSNVRRAVIYDADSIRRRA